MKANVNNWVEVKLKVAVIVHGGGAAGLQAHALRQRHALRGHRRRGTTGLAGTGLGGGV